MDADRLSPREQEVLDLLGERLTHAEIGRRLFISVRTVETHAAALRRKLGAPTHRDLVELAIARIAMAGGRIAGRRAPAALTSFVGRDAELSELVRLLRAGRLVSVVGAGGAGKTRLAAVATDAVSAQGGPQAHWADLAPVSAAGDVLGAVVTACGARISSRVGPRRALIQALSRSPALLVLDNVEHLVHAVSELAEELLGACPGLTVVVTSRVRLATAFEHVLRLEGLTPGPDGDAVDLFIQRARAGGARGLDDSARERIDALCAAVGQLPLAVELAAVRAASLGLDGLEAALGDQGRLLTGGSRLNRRHQSMNDTLAWSVSLLGPAEATLLRRLAPFVRPFQVADAQAVAGYAPIDPRQVADALAVLADNSLVRAPDTVPTTYSLLEPVRQYSEAQMTDLDRQAFARHHSWCLNRLQALRDAPARDGVASGMGWLADETRTSLAWARAQAPVPVDASSLANAFASQLFAEGRLDEARARWQEAAYLTDDPVQASDCLADAAAAARSAVLGETAVELELDAANRLGRAGDSAGQALALARAAEVITRFPGMFADVPPSAEELLARARRLAAGDPRVAAVLAVAHAAYAAPDAPRARRSIRAARAALDAATSISDPRVESSALDALTSAELFDGQVSTAYERSVARLDRIDAVPDTTRNPHLALELKDALHVAVFCAIGAGHLPEASRFAERQRGLPFLSQRRDLADDELIAPAALAGHWETALDAGRRFLDDWTAAGRPTAPGRGLAPAGVVLVHGLLGNQTDRELWLGVLARIRGVSPSAATRGTGYGELFDALVHLHHGRPVDALHALPTGRTEGLYSAVFDLWITAVEAEAAVLAGTPDAPTVLRSALTRTAGNPVASAITARANALHRHQPDRLAQIAIRLRAVGAPYQADRTEQLQRLSAGHPPGDEPPSRSWSDEGAGGAVATQERSQHAGDAPIRADQKRQ